MVNNETSEFCGLILTHNEVKNHGISDEVIEHALAASKSFFSLPLEKKMEVACYIAFVL